jgi:hypothetical protein
MPRLRLFIPSIAVALALTMAFACVAMADATTQPANPADNVEATIEKALVYLKAHQNPDSSWQKGSDPPAISALVLKAFLQNPHYDPKGKHLRRSSGDL